MLFKGTKKRSTAQIAGAVEGAGGEMNAFTSFEYTAYHITLPSDRWTLSNEILSDMVLGSVFKVGEFTPEKEVILEEIKRGEDSPERQLYQGMYSMAWPGGNYGRPVIGFPKTVSACTAASLKKYWNKWYRPSLMTVVIVGDVDPAFAMKEVERLWSKASGKAPRLRRRAQPQGAGPSPRTLRAHKNFDVNAIRWVAALPAVSMADERLASMDIAASILGQGEAARLHEALYKGSRSVTSVSAGVWAPFVDGLFTFDVEASVESGSSFMPEMKELLNKFAEMGPNAEELERAKAGIESERIYGAQSMDSLAHRLGYLKLCTGNAQFDLLYQARVRDTSAEDVRRAFASVWKSGPLIEHALFPKGYDAAPFWKNESIAPQATAAKTKSKAARTDGKPIPVLHRLPNGIDLILTRRDDVPVVNTYAAVLGGSRMETMTNTGIGSLLSQVWEKAPQGWTSERTARFLESRASRIGTFSGRNSAGVSSLTLSRHLSDILPLFRDILFTPALDENEFNREKASRLEDIKTYDDSPARLVDRLFCETLFEGHPYAMTVVGRPESVGALSVDDVKTHYSNLFSGRRVALAMAGKFDTDQVLSFFSSIERPLAAATAEWPPVQHPMKAPRVVETKRGREQSHVIYGVNGIAIKDGDRMSMRVLSTMLGGQSGRLFRELRDKQGLCYVVAPVSFEGIEPGYFGVYMGCDPAKRETAIHGIQTQLARLAEKAPTPVEVERAKVLLLGRHHMDLQLNSNIASTSAMNHLYGLGHDDHLKVAAGLKTVNPAGLKKLMGRLMDRPAVTAVVV
jgi:zinc protease